MTRQYLTTHRGEVCRKSQRRVKQRHHFFSSSALGFRTLVPTSVNPVLGGLLELWSMSSEAQTQNAGFQVTPHRPLAPSRPLSSSPYLSLSYSPWARCSVTSSAPPCTRWCSSPATSPPPSSSSPSRGSSFANAQSKWTILAARIITKVHL